MKMHNTILRTMYQYHHLTESAQEVARAVMTDKHGRDDFHTNNTVFFNEDGSIFEISTAVEIGCSSKNKLNAE